MTDQERINENLQRQIDAQNARIDNTLVKVDGLIRAMQDFKEEMRQQNQMRAEDMREIRQDMKEMQKSLDTKIDSISKHIRNLTITSMAAIGGMTVAVGAMVATVIYSLLRN